MNFWLDLFQKKSSNNNFVFLRPNGEPIDPNHIYRDFAKDQKKAGTANKITFHDLRLTFASQYIMADNDVVELSKILGHTNSPDHLQKSMKAFRLGQIEMDEKLESNLILTMRTGLMEKLCNIRGFKKNGALRGT